MFRKFDIGIAMPLRVYSVCSNYMLINQCVCACACVRVCVCACECVYVLMCGVRTTPWYVCERVCACVNVCGDGMCTVIHTNVIYYLM